MKLIDAAETERQLPFATLIPALREMFVTGCVVPPRRGLDGAGSAHA